MPAVSSAYNFPASKFRVGCITLESRPFEAWSSPMFKAIFAALVFALPAFAGPLDPTPQTRLDPELRCLLGAYALPDGRTVTITGDNGQARGLSYTLTSSRFGSLREGADGAFSDAALRIRFSPCDKGALSLTQGETTTQGARLPLVETSTSFVSDGVKLNGKLVAPAQGRAQALAVWIEGSNNNPSTDDTVWQYELARRGVAVFVYDKRGTGASEGAPTADFNLRAADTAAAVKEAKRLAPKIKRIGVIGGSQGGWVAPLTAPLTPLDFVIPAFAMAEGPIAQDQALVELQVRAAGFGAAEIEAARALTAITERIVRTNMEDGFADLDAFKAQHAGAAWLKAIQPRSYTGLFVAFSTADIKAIGPAAAQGLDFTYDPRPVIAAIKPRQLWLLGGADTQAPNAGTQRILRELQKQRTDVSVVVFPKAEHGLVQPADATGPAMAYAPQLFDVTADWIKRGKLPGAGRFVVMP
jgi:hypothetical protein